MDKRMWNPFKMLKTNIGKSSRLYIFILVVQDHIESIGKANTIKRGWDVAYWLACSKCLVICSKALNHFLTSTYVLNLKVKLSPTDLIYPAPSSSLDVATAKNPSHFGLTDGISVAPRWACKLSVAYCKYFSLTETCSRSHRVCLTNSLVSLSPKLVPPSLCNRSNQDEVLP